MSLLPFIAQQSAPGNAISLFRLDASSVGGGVLYFVQSAESDRGLTFQGNTYTPVDVAFTDFETTGQAQLPTPHLKLSNTNQVFQGIVNTVGDMQGCEVIRIRTFAQFLDDGDSADGTAFYGPDTFVIERKISENPVYIEWELSAAIDQAGKMLPGRVVVRDSCMWRYRIWNAETRRFDYTRAQCPYAGGAFFDYLDQPTTARNDQCSRRLSGCKLRFGEDAPLPYGGFPGAARVQG